MASQFVLTQKDIRFIKEMRRKLDILQPPTKEFDTTEPHVGADTYVIKAPTDGIPGLDHGIYPPGTGDADDKPGWNEDYPCDVYSRHEVEEDLYRLNDGVDGFDVYNLDSKVAEGEWRLAVRSNSGHMYVLPHERPFPVLLLNPITSNCFKSSGGTGKTVVAGNDISFNWKTTSHFRGSLPDNVISLNPDAASHGAWTIQFEKAGVYCIDLFFSVFTDYTGWEGLPEDPQNLETGAFDCTESHTHTYRRWQSGNSFVECTLAALIGGSSRIVPRLIIPFGQASGFGVSASGREVRNVAEDSQMTITMYTTNYGDPGDPEVTVADAYAHIQRLGGGAYPAEDWPSAP